MKKYAIAALVVIIFSFAYFVAVQGTTIIKQGDKYLIDGRPALALQKYEEAQRYWIPLRFNENLQNKITSTKQKLELYRKYPSIQIHIKDNATQQEIDTLVSDLRNISGVTKAEFISKSDLIEKLRENELINNDFGNSLETLTTAVIKVYVDDQTIIDKIQQITESKKFVKDVLFLRIPSTKQ